MYLGTTTRVKSSKTSPYCTTCLSPILITRSRSTHNAQRTLPRSFSLVRDFAKVICYIYRLLKIKVRLSILFFSWKIFFPGKIFFSTIFNFHFRKNSCFSDKFQALSKGMLMEKTKKTKEQKKKMMMMILL